MAEIKIEKKKSLWFWIILALVIFGVLIYMVMTPSDVDSERDVLPMERDSTGIGHVHPSLERIPYT